MAGDITVMGSLQDKIKDRIQSSFLDLVPQEMWDNLVQTELNKFMRDDLPRLVISEATKYFAELIKKEFEKPEWQTKWNGNGNASSEAVNAIIKEAAPDLVAAAMSGVVQNVVMYIRNNTQRF